MGASLADLEEAFKARAAHLRPCVDIQRLIPDEISECTGVHLRKSDKIDAEDNEYHGTTSDDLRHIMAALKSEVSSLIARGKSRFFVCSEDMAWKREFEGWLLGAGGVSIRLGAADAVASSRAGFDAILDFFALSQCERILQGIGYSTFSMAASLVHDVPLTNFSRKRSTQPSYFLNWWLPLLRHGSVILQGHRQACDRAILDIRVQN
ncbi:g697 [Coccomyxa elongata]